MLVEAIFAVRKQVEKQREDRKSEENRKRGSAMSVDTYLHWNFYLIFINPLTIFEWPLNNMTKQCFDFPDF